jgi:gelsolin
MIKPKTIDIEDSNIAGLGSQADKDARVGAASTEEAWTKADLKKVGVNNIWRIEKFKVVPWPKEEFGNFYSGDSYIILRTYLKKSEEGAGQDKIAYDLHFWIGEKSSQDEYGTAAYKTVELDDYINGTQGADPVQHREVQGHESDLFLSYFPKIQILDGGVDSGFRKVEPTKYQPRLLHVKGKKNVQVRQVEFKYTSLNHGDVFVIDGGLKLIQFNGKDSNIAERNKGGELVRALRSERHGKPSETYLDVGDNMSEWWAYFPEKGEIPEAIPDTVQPMPKKMFQLSDASGSMTMTEVPLDKKKLDSNDVFIVDCGHEVFVWIGKGASKDEKKKGMTYATDYLSKNGRSLNIPISSLIEGSENASFNNAFKP